MAIALNPRLDQAVDVKIRWLSIQLLAVLACRQSWPRRALSLLLLLSATQRYSSEAITVNDRTGPYVM